MKFTKKSIYIGLFSVLYLIVAFSSFWHACAFFGLANNAWMSVILALAFEIGQAAVLFSLLTSKKDRNRIMPWVLMSMFTLVQVIGNVYSSYKYIITNSVENLRYFKEPIFIWTELPDAQANVIIVYLVGALLPIAALLLTSMITNYLSDQEEEKLKELENIHSNELTQAQPLKESDEDAPEVEDEEIPDDKEHTITFKDGEEIVRSITGKIGTYVSVPSVEKEGYEFLGWSIDGKNVTMPVDGIYDSDITYVALWEKKQQEDNSKDKQIEELKKRIDEVEEDHDKMVDQKFEAERKFEDLLQDYSNQNKEIYQLKQELDKLKNPKIQQIPSNEIHKPIAFSEPEGLKQSKETVEKIDIPEEYKDQIEDLIKNGINENKIEKDKNSHFIN